MTLFFVVVGFVLAGLICLVTLIQLLYMESLRIRARDLPALQFFKETLEALKNRFINRLSVQHILSKEKTDTPLNQGRIDAAKCAKLKISVIDHTGCRQRIYAEPETSKLTNTY